MATTINWWFGKFEWWRCSWNEYYSWQI